MSHKKAKLLRKLMRGGVDDVVVSDNVGFEKTISLSEVMDIFAPELEELTDALVDELRADGMRVERLEEMRQMGLKYNRRRRSFTSGEIGSF
jgi:hypothetical protein